ncbi:hypothetical protein ACFLY6_02185 [Candidatus Dependentiae bacterium]
MKSTKYVFMLLLTTLCVYAAGQKRKHHTSDEHSKNKRYKYGATHRWLEKLWKNSPIEICEMVAEFAALTEKEAINQIIEAIDLGVLRQQKNLPKSENKHPQHAFLTDELKENHWFSNGTEIILRGLNGPPILLDAIGESRIYESRTESTHIGIPFQLPAKTVVKIESFLDRGTKKARRNIRQNQLASTNESIQSTPEYLRKNLLVSQKNIMEIEDEMKILEQKSNTER